MPCHKRDWKKYNKQLINHDNLNFLVAKKALKFWKAKQRTKADRPFSYIDGSNQIDAHRVSLIPTFTKRIGGTFSVLIAAK